MYLQKLIVLCLEKCILSSLATKIEMVNKILKETHILEYRSSMLNFFMKFEIFRGTGFLNFFSKLQHIEELLRLMHPNKWSKSTEDLNSVL
jgi:hypothetical protein